MKLADLDESLTPVPVEAAAEAFEGGDDLAVLPVHEQERGTACILVVRKGQLWIACRTQGDARDAPPAVATDSVEWHRVGIGPLGTAGRVPGGYLGGPEASNHFVTVVAGDHLYEAKLPGSRGMEAVEGFASAALHAGARDFEP